MGIPHYLAMTGAELARNPPPGNTAWLACHFSSYNNGLSNFPAHFPPNGLLILDDSTPIGNHSKETAAQQLLEKLEQFQCIGLLLDFQRPNVQQSEEIAAYLADTLPCPVGISHLYAQVTTGPVFLPPVPAHRSLLSYLQSWKSREIWLETSLDAEVLTLTETGCAISPASQIPLEGFSDPQLHCHYSIETGSDFARFLLWRTDEDLDALLMEAEQAGVAAAVGLWQELHR